MFNTAAMAKEAVEKLQGKEVSVAIVEASTEDKPQDPTPQLFTLDKCEVFKSPPPQVVPSVSSVPRSVE